jgi:putative ABC transport system permease protein
VGDEGQRALPGSATGSLPQPTAITTRAERRDATEGTGANQLLTFAFVVGTGGGVALALLAIGFTVLAEANSRGRALSRLRTMGLSARQGRRLLAYELVPLLGVAVLAGAAVGVMLPRLLGPSLGLDTFTAGMPARTHLDPLLVAGLLGLAVVAVAAAIGFESLVNRRMRLGEVLRLGEEN